MQPVGKQLVGLNIKGLTESQRSNREATLLKFQESAWKAVAYISLTVISAVALQPETFWHSTREFWSECSRVPCEFESTPRMLVAYASDMAYYTYAIPYCIFFETKRRDFWATFAHHIVTVMLIGYSFCLGFTKVGVVVMFLHDICDPFLELAKMARYAGWDMATNTLFVIFTVTWIAMRDVYLPGWVIWSVLFEAWEIVVGDQVPPEFPHWELFSGMLIVLWVLHVYWTYAILKIAVEAVSAGSLHDTREKSAHED